MLVYLLIALLSAILAFIPSKIIAFIINLFVTPKRIKECINTKHYHTVIADYVPRRNDMSEPNEQGDYTYLYEYEIEGEKRRYLINSRIPPSSQIKLYYVNNPKYIKDNLNCLSWKEIGISKKTKKIIFAIITCIIFIFITICWKLN